jgi:hypothetical protein
MMKYEKAVIRSEGISINFDSASLANSGFSKKKNEALLGNNICR